MISAVAPAGFACRSGDGGLRLPADLPSSGSRMAMPLDIPPVIGHRGAAALAPENTLAGFRAARACGARWVEFDVRLTADGIPVVIHDAALDRVAGRTLRVARLPLARLKALDVGSWFGARFAGEAVPTLEEALAECRVLGLGANVELKWCGTRSRALVRATAAILRDATGLPVLASSFRPAMLAAMRRHAPAVPRGLLMSQPRPGWRALVRRLDCASLHVGARRLDERRLAALLAPGLPVVVYTVNDPDRAAALLAAGVHSVITDRPDAVSVAKS